MAKSNNACLESLVKAVNKLQEIASQCGEDFCVNLPQIVVVGAQSSGKSSVLESFVGKDFLPRGADIVTRCPLILQLYNGKEDYAEFEHSPGKKFINFDKVRKEIETETDRLTGTKKGISKIRIVLKVYSPKFTTLTLVDLPGLTKVPVKDQPEDIGQQIQDMVLEYISQDTAIILAISPANCDLANSESLNIARMVDPNQERTIGVLTKLDLMDKGTNAVNVLNNQVYKLKRGFVGIVNRSQEDINEKKSISNALKDEALFFEDHPEYKHLIGAIGTKYLQAKLSEELKGHVKQHLPSMKIKIEKICLEKELELKKYDHTVFDNEKDRKKYLGTIIAKVCKKIEETIASDENSVNEIEVCVDINNIILQTFAQTLDAECVEESLLEIYIENSMKNSILTTSTICQKRVFDGVVKEVVKMYLGPIITLVNRVTDFIEGHICKLSNDGSVFPNFNKVIADCMKREINLARERSKKYVVDTISMESAFIFTNRPEFLIKKDEAINEQIASEISEIFINTLDISGKSYSQTIGSSFKIFETNQSKKAYLSLDANQMLITSVHTTEEHHVYEITYQPETMLQTELVRMVCYVPIKGVGGITCLDSFIKEYDILTEIAVDDILSLKSLIEKKKLKKPIEEVKAIILNYLKIVCQNLKVTIPKMIHLFVIDRVIDYSRIEIMPELLSCSSDEIEKWTVIDSESEKIIKSLNKAVSTCTDALTEIEKCEISLAVKKIDINNN
uniref:Dynamin-type G domain-containing protein n=1 Tax=Rhabditophanes sp. KR3021 TaxID=114890 RepID=A0AC35U1R0_9BILA